MTTSPELSREQRDAAMVARYVDGETLEAISQRFGLTVERVREIIVQVGGASAQLISEWRQSGDYRVQILDAYRQGDPLRVIAADHDLVVDFVAAILRMVPSAEIELERAKAVRRRSRATAEAILNNSGMIDRLRNAGIEQPDIPKVLTALGVNVDVEISVELLGIPRHPKDHLEWTLPPKRLSDRLSLLYIIGKHHGVQPDYQLALGKVSTEAVSELRELIHPHFPCRQFAEILAMAECTALAIRGGELTSISYCDYDAASKQSALQLGAITRDPHNPWPVPAATLRWRLGHGFWDDAQRDVGMGRSPAVSGLDENDFFQALDDFTEECIELGLPLELGTYDRWVFVEASTLHVRPSLLEMVQHYGSWSNAMQTIIPGDAADDVEEIVLDEAEQVNEEPRYHDYDSGGPFATLEELNEWEAAEDEKWSPAKTLIGELLARMPWNSFLQIQYGEATASRIAPYAQATPGPDGVWCEVVSENYLSPRQWPLSLHYFETNGWSPPTEEIPNWHKTGVPLPEASSQLLNALFLGRQCLDAEELRWSVGQFPSGPGPDGGVTVEHALAGEVQSLRNAS